MSFILLIFIFALQILILKEIIKMSQATDAFAAAVTKLGSDVAALVAQGSSGTQAAVDAFATQATVQVQAIDAQVLAASPAAPPATPAA